MVKGPNGCILKDDVNWLMDKFLESDGYILGAPVCSLSPCGVITDFRDRLFGPKMDVATGVTSLPKCYSVSVPHRISHAVMAAHTPKSHLLESRWNLYENGC